MENELIIETRNLTKAYPGKISLNGRLKWKVNRAVDNVNMHVKRGSIYGLIGKNGAGKTTLMKMLSGLAAPNLGEISLFGRNTFAAKEDPNMYKRIGTLLETPGLFPNMSARDNLRVKAICMGICNYNKKIDELLELVELDLSEAKKVKNFSMGMRQRLGIALALIGNPDLLILDEPINGLDPQGIVGIRELLIRLNRERNITILISSHILEELSKLVTDYGIIRDGRLIEEISRDELAQKCMDRIEIKTDSPDSVIPVLAKENVRKYKVVDSCTIHVYEQFERVAQINKSIVLADIPVYAIGVSNGTIEDYFIDVTGR